MKKMLLALLILLTACGAPTINEFVDEKGVPMVLVSAGEFTMGSNDENDDAKPVHTVYLDAFYIDKYEIINALYKACADSGVCQPLRSDSVTRPNYYGNPQFDNYPVIFVDWNMAMAYCEWRGARLPTEAEWEKAARGTDGRIFPWGEGIDKTFANYNDYVGDTTAVGSYEIGQSQYGVYDMAGNVWEWVADWYSETYYQNSPLTDPLGPDSGEYHVVRGGSWNYVVDVIRSAHRSKGDGTIAQGGLGFRCAKDAIP